MLNISLISKDKVVDVIPFLSVALQAGCNCDVRIGNLWGWKAYSDMFCFITSKVLAVE